ncbi:MAG: hypothetical protein WA733_19055 [Methylocystis sp.]
MRRFNEGKACDAVIRRIEAREGCSRRDFSFPEKENHAAPVEFTCLIGDRQFAFEHTSIEPFEGLTELEAKEQVHFKPIRDRLVGRLPPTEHFVLHIPVKATLGLKRLELLRIQDAIVAWVESVALSLPIARLDRYVIDNRYSSIPGVPFEVALHRVQKGGLLGQISIVHLVERNLEAQRISRIRRAYGDKAKKLAAWRQLGARSVLILEENDKQLTNHVRVADALIEVEQGMVDRPDEIYLLSSANEKTWFLWALRVDDHVYDELSVWGDSLMEIDPTTLVNITER